MSTSNLLKKSHGVVSLLLCSTLPELDYEADTRCCCYSHCTVQKELQDQRGLSVKKDPTTNWHQKQGAYMMATSIVKVHSGDKEKDTAGRSAEKQWSGSALI